VARALNNLGELSWKVGQPEQAEAFFLRALQIWEQALGSDHPLIAYPLHGLANLYSEQRSNAEVEQLFLRALSLREHHLGSHHPETAQTLHDLALYRKKQGNLDEARALAERALKISLQALGETHRKTVATRTLSTQLTQERDHTEPNDASPQRKPTPLPEKAPHTPQKTIDLGPSEKAHFQDFLHACCNLHARAWSRSSELWQVYEQWSKHHQEHFPLSRRAFTNQLKAHGCRADRTNTDRIWRGIAIVTRNSDKK
jgi:tetratricopeptide (TPR) repeat protein